jgi:hypothetical protein
MNTIEYITSFTNCFNLFEGETITVPLQVLSFGGKRISRDLIILPDNNVLKVLNQKKLDAGNTELTVSGIEPGISRLIIETVEKTSNPLWLLFYITKKVEVIWSDRQVTNEQFDSNLAWKVFLEQNKSEIVEWKLIQ